MSNAITSHGTLIKRNTTTVGELRDITPPPLTRSSFDVSTQNDLDDAYVIGIRRHGEMQFNVNFLPSGDATHGTTNGLLYAYSNGTKDAYQVLYPDGSSWSFSGYVTNVSPKAPVDGAFDASVTIRPTGGFTFA